MKPAKRISITILANIAVTVVLFLTIEGLSSVVIIVKETFFNDVLQERKHTQYDEEIGWINEPNLHIEDMYGPGRSFSTNSMAVRSNHETSPSIPTGKIRVVCSGDSFTMGYGVDTNAGWCQQLESIDNHFESVNLGQGGYGVDQAYLWYKRNSTKIAHDIQLFAFITDDFRRMQSDKFQGYGKPFLKVENSAIVNTNRPVPRISYIFPRFPLLRDGIGNLNVVKLLQRALVRVKPSGKPDGDAADNEADHQDSETRKVVLKIFEELQNTNQAKDSLFVLVYLPRRPNDSLGKESGPWRQFIHDVSVEHGFPIVDLVDEMAKLSPQESEGLYSDNGHYSEKGNLIAAQLLYKQLAALPAVAAKLQQKHIPASVNR